MYEGVYMHVWIYHDVSMGIIEQQSTIENKYLTDEEWELMGVFNVDIYYRTSN